MALPSVKQFLSHPSAGIDFRRIDDDEQFPQGMLAKDQFGQTYRYCKVATDLSIADADEDTLAVTFTYVLNAGTNGGQTGATDGDGSVNGAITSVTAAAIANSDSIDGVLERRGSGTGVQVNGDPDPKYLWIKVAGIANRLKKAAGLDAGQYADRIASGGALVEETAAGASLGNRFGRCIAEHTTTGGAGLAGDFVFDVTW